MGFRFPGQAHALFDGLDAAKISFPVVGEGLWWLRGGELLKMVLRPCWAWAWAWIRSRGLGRVWRMGMWMWIWRMRIRHIPGRRGVDIPSSWMEAWRWWWHVGRRRRWHPMTIVPG